MKVTRSKPLEIVHEAVQPLRFLEGMDYLRAFIEWHDPDNIDAQYRCLLPRDAVVATRTPLLPHSEIWFQLSEDNRRTFRAVYFHVKAAAYAKRGDPRDITQNMLEAERRAAEKIIVRDWLRWLAVEQAKSERQAGSKRLLSWKKAYKEASKRLKDTIARGAWSSMKKAYVSVNRILIDAGLQSRKSLRDRS